ncbi:MAG: peptidoglycan glycosyltransferase [Clostridia bacterium]|nr:peptidoglycan glycosyltransferase [Clostridia bacterium]
MKKSQLDKNGSIYKEETRLIVLLCIVGLLFLCLVGYLTYIEVFSKEEFINNAFNQRQWKQEENTLRGDIVDRDGVILAYSTMNYDEKTQTREYPYNKLYTHLVGYTSKIYGKSQIELAYNKQLAGLTDLTGLSDLTEQISGNKKGDTVTLTISNKLQNAASKVMGNRNGAVVAIQPKTGEVLCMLSNPSFSPDSQSLQEKWSLLNDDETSPFVARATNGLYAPGSIFKTILLCAALDNELENIEIDDNGEYTVGNKTFTNSGQKAFGRISLEESYAVSSNVAFMQTGDILGQETVKNYMKKFKIADKIPFELTVAKSRFDYDETLNKADFAQLCIGQGKLLVTPFQMALMVSGIANNGILQKPYIVSKVTSSLGIAVESTKPQIWDRIVSASTAAKVTEYMTTVVDSGTGYNAKINGIKVAGKTGTAENEVEGKEHTWFVGFAPADDPTIAVAVICEYSGNTGGSDCAPVAAQLFKTWLNN